MEALKTLTLALAAASLAAACGGDDGGKPTANLDAGTHDASIDSGSTNQIPTSISLPDGGPLPCTGTTPPSGNLCGGSSCQQTQADLKAGATAGAKCGSDSELMGFCSLSTVNTVTMCSYMFLADLPTQLDKFASDTTTCASAQLGTTVSPGCLDCYVQSARCTADKCLGQCASGTGTALCDACRIYTGCIKTFYDCAGYADPLAPIEATLPK